MTDADLSLPPNRSLTAGQRIEVSPEGTMLGFVELPGGDHAARTDDGSRPLRTVDPLGGHGTRNVNSWSRDGRRFSPVDYPLGGPTPPVADGG